MTITNSKLKKEIKKQTETINEIIKFLKKVECDSEEGTVLKLKDCEDFKNIPLYICIEKESKNGENEYYIHPDTRFEYQDESFNPMEKSVSLANANFVKDFNKQIMSKDNLMKSVTINQLEKIMKGINQLDDVNIIKKVKKAKM